MSAEDLINSLNNLSLNLSTDSDSASQSQTEVPVNSIIQSSTENNYLPENQYLGVENQQISINRILDSSVDFNLENNINEENMANQFKPEFLNCVPTFDGNATELNRYLAICQSIISQFYDATNPANFQNVYILNSLIGKLTGNAKLVINIQNVTTWQEVKDTLYRNFADRRDESCLNRDLVMLRQNPNESAQIFYDKCLEILNLLCSYIDAHETVAAALVKRELYQKLALKTFLSGLREPLGTTIRCMRPESLTEAIQLVNQERNVKYFQNGSQMPPKHFSNNQNTPIRPLHQNQRFGSNIGFARPQFNNFSQPFNAHTNHNQFRQNTASFSNPNRPQMNFRPPFGNQNNSGIFGRSQQNVFKPNPFRPLPKPTPMSVVTNSVQRRDETPGTSHQQNHFQQPRPKYTFQELYNTEANTYSDYDTTYDYQNYNPDLSHDYSHYVDDGEYAQEYPLHENADSYKTQSQTENESQGQNFQDAPQENEQT